MTFSEYCTLLYSTHVSQLQTEHKKGETDETHNMERRKKTLKGIQFISNSFPIHFQFMFHPISQHPLRYTYFSTFHRFIIKLNLNWYFDSKFIQVNNKFEAPLLQKDNFICIEPAQYFYKFYKFF